MARTRYRFAEPDRPHFLTSLEWLPVFTRPETAQVLFDTWTWQQEHAGLRLLGFVVLENHLHAVAQAPDLPATWAHFKSFTALRIIEILQAHRAHLPAGPHGRCPQGPAARPQPPVLAGGVAPPGHRGGGDAAAEVAARPQ